jgi:signal peptidase I
MVTAMSEQVAENPKKFSWDETIRTIVTALLLALLFRSFAFEPFHIPSGSMKDTLLVGDYLFVSKYTYGYSRFSFPLSLPIFKGRILDSHKPQRGDVVVFRVPSDTRIDFIKRIIGLPGDQVQVKGGIVYINGAPLPRTPTGEFADAENPSNVKSIKRFAETLPEGKVIGILKQYEHGAADDTQLFNIPPGHYFMMGDNRDNSHDSRYLNDVGYVPEENLVGRAEIIFFSADSTADLKNPLTWIPAMRFDRFFKLIE